MARLKHHHIVRVATVYAITAYILIQAANAVFPDVGLSRADVRYIIAALALLLPVALVLGWMFIPPSKQNPDQFSHWQRLHFRLGSVLAVVIVGLVTFSGVVLWHANVQHLKNKAVIAAETTAASIIPAKSIAVLPFANDSGDPKQQYFSDGLSEGMIIALSRVNVE